MREEIKPLTSRQHLSAGDTRILRRTDLDLIGYFTEVGESVVVTRVGGDEYEIYRYE